MENMQFTYTNPQQTLRAHRAVSKNEEDSYFQLHKHVDTYELLLFIKGDCSSFIAGRTYKLSPYDFLIISDQELHRIYSNAAISYDRFVLNISKSFLLPFLSNNYDLAYCLDNHKKGTGNLVPAYYMRESGALKLLESVIFQMTHPSAESHLQIQLMVVQLLIELNKFAKSGMNPKPKKQKSTEIVEYIDLHLTEPLPLEEIASQFYLNKHYLCHVFKQETGFTVLQYITYKRIMKAVELLRSGMSAQNVSIECGFNNYSNFYKTFMKTTGQPPSSYSMA